MSTEHEREGEMVPSKEKRNSPESIYEANRLVRIADRCPSCGSQNLFIGSKGWITCGWIECKEPGLTTNIAANQQAMQALQERVKELEGQNEQLQVQLAGCAVAALGGTKEPATRGMYGWSPAYQDVLDLRQRADRLQSEVERLKTISLCRCGDSFTAEDPGTCGNCLATYYQDVDR